MSSSISFRNSTDLDTMPSRGFSPTFSTSENFTSREPEATGANYGTSENINSCPKTHLAPNQRLDLDKENFYEQVDERMSKNSCEYPEEQAKYLNNWLDQMEMSNSSKFVDDPNFTQDWGNVIGIRGFPLEKNTIQKDHQHEGHTRLKYNYVKVKSDLDKLQAHYQETTAKFRKIFKRKDHEVELLKALVAKRGKQTKIIDDFQSDPGRNTVEDKSSQTVTGEEETDVARLVQHSKQLELKLSSYQEVHEGLISSLKAENESLKKEISQCRHDMDELRSGKQETRTIDKELLGLRNENRQLKEIFELNQIEFLALKESYLDLEAKMKCLIEDQKCFDEDKSEELRAVMLELCRYQVNQPKLEMILDTERAIKSELEARIGKLVEDNQLLDGLVNEKTHELHMEQLRSKREESADLVATKQELTRWQDKFYRLEREKADCEDLLRAIKSRELSQDEKHREALELAGESSRQEVETMKSDIVKLETERDLLNSKLNQLEDRYNECNQEREKLVGELIELNRKLELSLEPQELSSKLMKESDERNQVLINELRLSETKRIELTEELERAKSQLELARQQVVELEHKNGLLQQSLEDVRAKKDKELARLRVNLNLEKYNRQVALRGIEKELRDSLKELETMKCRFSRRLIQNDSIAPDRLLNRVVELKYPEAPISSQMDSLAAKLISKPFRGGAAS